MLHGYINKLIMVAKSKKQNPEGTGITEKRSEKAMWNVNAIVSFDEEV